LALLLVWSKSTSMLTRLTSHTAWKKQDEKTSSTKSVKRTHHKRFISRFVRLTLRHFLLGSKLHDESSFLKSQ
jgi:hypothetical protein